MLVSASGLLLERSGRVDGSFMNTGSSDAPEGEGHTCIHGYDYSGPWLGYRFVGIGGIPDIGTEKGKFPTFNSVIKNEH